MGNTTTYIYLARHGETPWNREGRWQGQTDIALNEVGRDQARDLAERVKGLAPPVDRIHSSDLLRAHETGEIVARELGLAFGGTHADLRERNFGVFEGLTTTEVAQRYPEAWADYSVARRVLPPGAEAHEDVIHRMRQGVWRVFDSAAGGTALIVSHGGALRILLRSVTGEEIPPIPNGAVFRLAVAGRSFVAAEPLT